jgi:uncharacterized BrkB/YihY/UPF0761 family membrane protein
VDDVREKLIAQGAYDEMAEAYAALADTKPHNAYYERPASTGEQLLLRVFVLSNSLHGRWGMSETAVPQKRRVGLVIWMIVSQLLTLGSLVLWLVVAGLSVMAFDSGVTPEAWRQVLTVWAYPLFPLIMVIGAWVAFAYRRNRLAAILTGLPLVPPALLLLLLWMPSLVGWP